VFVIEWKGRLKRRGLNSVLGCDASGKVVVSAKPGSDQIAAKWNDYFSKIKPEGAECVKTGMELSQLYFESSDPNAKLTLPTDQVLRPIYDKCDAFMRAKQPQQNFACTLSGGIRSFCDSVYAERRSDGQLTRISRVEAIKLQLAGREWALGNVETADAKTNRVRLEEEARNRQAADSAAKQKQEEEQKAKQAADAAVAAAAARKRQEEAKTRPSPSQEANRTSAPSTQPKQEQPKAEPAPPPPPPPKQEPAKPKPTVKSTTDL
jgi:pyruvate/2-oxoglutarate dehydrogenase complex dihydrolipoamide acyltransferase (E2) component